MFIESETIEPQLCPALHQHEKKKLEIVFLSICLTVLLVVVLRLQKYAFSFRQQL